MSRSYRRGYRLPINLGWVVLAATVVYLVAGIVFTIARHNVYERDIDGWVIQAVEASEPEVIVDRLQKAKAGMERHGATSGHTAVLLENPTNDLKIRYSDLDDLIERTERIIHMEDPVEAQVAFNDVRATLNWGMNDVSGGLIWNPYGVWLLWGTIGGLVLAFVVSMVSDIHGI